MNQPTTIAVSGVRPGDPGASEVMEHPAPPIRGGESPSAVRVGAAGGVSMPEIDMEGAPVDDPRYNPTSGEYVAPPSNLPGRVSAAQILRENRERWGTSGPADNEAAAPILAGTKVAERGDE
jgi:hypothetical protein